MIVSWDPGAEIDLLKEQVCYYDDRLLDVVSWGCLDFQGLILDRR